MSNKTGDTYSTVSSWDESVLSFEELRGMVEKAANSRAEYISEVRKYVGTLRLCPLIIKMYGGMAEVFGVDSFDKEDIYSPRMKIEMPKASKVDPHYYFILCGGGARYDGP